MYRSNPRKLPPADYAIDHPVFHSLLRRHNVVPIHVALYFFQGLPGSVRQNAIEKLPRSQNVTRLYVNVCRLPAQARCVRLMDKNS